MGPRPGGAARPVDPERAPGARSLALDGSVVVNGAHAGQRVTGQQRYAREIGARLVAGGAGELLPPPRLRASSAGSWAWSLSALPVAARDRTLVSLTSRAPLVHPRHVVAVHDLFVLTHPEWYGRRYVATHAPHLRATLRSAAAVVAVSEPVADEVRASGLTAAPVTVAPNAPSTVFRPGPEQAAGHGVPGVPDEGFLLVVGSHDPRKNLARLVEAYGTLPELVRREHPLVVVGGSAPVFRQTEIPRVAGVVTTGYVDDETLAGLYRRARGVVFPSLAEGFGLPLVEAALAGATVAASDIPVFRWIAGEHPVWFDPASVEGVRDGLLRLLDAPSAQDGFAASVARRFDWDVSAATVASVCASVAAERR